MYLYQEEQMNNKETALPVAYNKAISITNEIYSALGDKSLVKNDIGKIKEMQDIIAKLVEHKQPEIKYLGKALAGILSELIV